ncbi:MAG: ABC transporter substrate-binding protein [Pseudomonadota bacterium]
MKIIQRIIALSLLALPAHAEVGELRVAKQYGLGYLQMMMMEDQKLIETHAKAVGLGELPVTWATFRSSDVMNDALISGSVDFVCLGPAGLATIWAKTRGNIDVRAAAAMNAQPNFLNTRKPEITSIKDFSEKDRIALPAVKVAMQAIALQMAAAAAFGPANYAKLDSLTISMAHPDGMVALLSGGGEITAHYTSAPFQYKELASPGVHKVLDSYDALGGPYTFNVIATTAKFRNANPKTYAVFLAAFAEATDAVNRDKPAAAAAYLRIAQDKSPVSEILAMMNDPAIEFTLVPKRLMKIADFMHQVGSIKVAPASWKDLFFENAHDLPGS